MPGPLGCSEVNVVAQPRGGSAAVPIGLGTSRDWSSLEWHRLPNDASGMQLRIEGRAQCCDWASRVVAWKHELCVYDGGDRVWSGPVTQVHWVGDELRIDCKDRSEWFRRRKIHYDHEYGSAVDLATIFHELAMDALSVDTSPGVRFNVSPSGTLVSDPEGRKYLAAQNLNANDALNELSRTAIEWTCLDMIVHVRGPQSIQGDIPTLRPSHFEDEPEALEDGDLFGTRFYASGAGRGAAGDTIVGTNVVDPALEAEYGVHERMIDEPLVRDQASATASAQSTFDLYGADGIPFFLLGGKLNATAPVAINDLIPGKIFRVQTEDPCKPVPQYVRLAAVEGNVGPEHQYVSVTFEPLGPTE